jgi:hypothetical protein
MTDEEAEKMASDTTAYTVPEYSNDGLHGASNGGAQEKFVVKEDAALGNRSEVAEIVSAEYKRGYDEGFAAGVASVPVPTKPKPTKRKPKKAVSVESIESRSEKEFAKPIPPVPAATEPPGLNDDADEQARLHPEYGAAPL